MAPRSVLVVIIGLLVWLPVLISGFKVVGPQGAVDQLASEGYSFRPILGVLFSASIPPEGITSTLYILPTSNLACGSPPIPAEAAGQIILTERGACAFQDKGQTVQDAGGAAMVVYNNQGNTQADGLAMQGNGTILNIVCEGLSLVEGIKIQNLTQAYGTLTVMIYQENAVPSHKAALLDLWNSAGGAGWNYGGVPFDGWTNDTDPCTYPWQAVTCQADGSVTILNLGMSNLVGTIPDSFSVFTTLTVLDVSVNSLYGTLPEYFGTFTAMQQLSFATNNFTGTIPESYVNMTSLEWLDFSVNSLYGTVPAGLWNFEVMNTFALNSNMLEGEFPMLLPNTLLMSFDVSNNFFTGNLSNLNVSLLETLAEFSLSNNLFEGTIPESFGSIITLSNLQLAGNKFYGEIPASFTALTQLQLLDISNNSFSGTVPEANLPPKLRSLLASHNQFTTIPTSFISHTTLISVDLSYNQLTGSYTDITSRLPVPKNQQALDQGFCLQYIDLSHNMISVGTSAFQLTVMNWEALVSFKMNDNRLSKQLQVLGYNNPYLKTLDLSNNELTGTLPAEFTLFTALTELSLANNSLSYVPTGNQTTDVYLPKGFVPDYTSQTYYAGYSFNCPTIRMGDTNGIAVNIDPYYHGWQLCQCDVGGRRVVDAVPNSNWSVPVMDPQFTCITCQLGLQCPGRANDTTFEILAHYYPTPSFENPEQLLDCPSCTGGTNEYMNCSDNHEGRLCSKCEHGTFLRGQSCEKCAPIGSVFIVVSIFILVLLVVGFTIFTLVQRQLCGACFPSLPTMNASFFARTKSIDNLNYKERVEKHNSVAALLIAINYYQTVSALSQYYDLPVSVTQLLSAVKIITSVTGAGLGMECLNHHLQYYKYLYIAEMLEPVICLAAVLVVYVVGKLYTYTAHRVPTILHEWEITCLKMALFVINLLFFPITSSAINAFRCTADPVTGISYNTQYPYSECGSISLAGRVIALLVYSAGVVFLFGGLILYYITKSNGDDKPGTATYVIQKSFGFFFLHFRDRYFWFSLAILLRRFIISLITSLVRVNSVLSFGLNNLVLVGSAMVVLIKRPFRTHVDNLLECSTILAALFIYGAAVLMSAPGFTYGAVVIEVFYFLVNVLVLLWCALEFLRTNFPVIVSFWRNQRKGKKGSIGASGAMMINNTDSTGSAMSPVQSTSSVGVELNSSADGDMNVMNMGTE